MYAAAINRSSPTTGPPEDVRRFAAGGVLARELGRSYQRGRDARHLWHAYQGRLIPNAAQESACTLPKRRPGLRPIKAQGRHQDQAGDRGRRAGRTLDSGPCSRACFPCL
jgi:hypothetical protein